MKVPFSKRLVSVYGWCRREVLRVFRVWNQTLLGPFVESLMMVVLFGMFISVRLPSSGESYAIIAGLLGGVAGMTNTRNAFMATSTPLVIARMVGYGTDYTALPFAVNNIRIGTIAGALVRCVICTVFFMLVAPLFGVKAVHPASAVLVAVVTAINFGLVGVVVGALCSNFEQSSTVNSYLIVPLSMLSGTFVPISELGPIFHKIALFNPFFYASDLMRYCFTNVSLYNFWKELGIFAVFMPVFWSISGLFVKRFVRGDSES